MKKIMGIDISSRSTGWSIVQDDKLLEYGKINPTGKTMSPAQKMFLFHVELKKIIERYSPDEIAIEDVPLVKSASVAKLLAKFNGVAVIEAYRHLQRDPVLYMPPEWKTYVEGCTGSSKKCEIQIAICKIFGLLSNDKIQTYQDRITEAAKNEAKEGSCEAKDEVKSIKKQIKKAKKSGHDVSELEAKLAVASELAVKCAKSKKRDMSDAFDQISMDIYTETSINEDIADSIGVAIAFKKQHLQK